MDEAHKLRIGELAYRVGVRPEVLRAWERRYQLLQPARSERGFRLYSEVDEWRVRLMQQKLKGGLSAAEAAQAVSKIERERAEESFGTPLEFAQELSAALAAFDEDAAHDVLDRLLGVHGLERAIRETLMPYLRELGDRWARQEISVAQEHFASRLLEARLLALARGWNTGPGRSAVLACPSGEQHTLPLICFGLVLRSRGWRNIYLGGESPVGTVLTAADTVGANVIVLSAVTPDRYVSIGSELKAIARKRRLVVAGAGATPEVEAQLGLECLTGDPATAAEAFSRQLVREEAPA
jgi:DNA-binding transcriptional MerR regulator